MRKDNPSKELSHSEALERLSLLYKISETFGSTLEPDELLPKIFDTVIDALKAEAGSIWLLEKGSGELRCGVAKGPVAHSLVGSTLPLGQGIVGHVAEKGEPVIVADVQNDPRFEPKFDRKTGFATRSMISAPLTAKGEVLGAVQVINKDKGELFTDDDLLFLVDICNLAALSLKNARLFKTESKAELLEALLGMSREIASTLDLSRILRTLVNLPSSVTATERCAVGLYTRERFKLNAISGLEKLKKKDEELKDLERILSWVGDAGEEVYVVLVNDELNVEREETKEKFKEYFEKSGMKGFLGIPLKDEQGRIGVISLESRSPEFLSESEREMVSILGSQASVAIRNAQLYEEVPLISLIQPILEKKRGLMKTSLRRRVLLGALFAVFVLWLFLGKIPLFIHGDFEILPSERANVAAEVGGILRSVFKTEGEDIEKGEAIALLGEEELRLLLDEKTSEAEMARREARRLREAGDLGASRVESLREAQFLREAELARKKLEKMRIVSPISGTIITPKLEDKVGRLIEEGEIFCEVGDLDRLRVEVGVGEGDISSVEVGQKVSLRPVGFPGESFTAIVETLSPKAEQRNFRNVFIVVGELDNSGRILRAGMTGRARIEGGETTPAKVVFGKIINFLRSRLWF